MKPSVPLFLNIGHPLFSSIDASKAEGVFVVVDPLDRSNLLYLNELQYNKLVNVTLTQSVKLVVVARPEDDVFKALEMIKSSKK